ncbi:hypothetical protein ACIRL2_51075 [Embleya sp. NPDC127516]|uniref:hypothetical protein n=1 Tax=Embleya sp. NPDC127516 TaxID=3363990 RepID=UPI003805CB45
MAGLRMTVCLPAKARDGDLAAAIGAAMAPFEEDHTSDEARDIWDRWTVRGGSDGCGYFVAPGYADDPRLVHDTPWSVGEELPSLPGMSAGGPREALDFTEPRTRARTALGAGWDLWRRINADGRPVQPLSRFKARYESEHGASSVPEAFWDYRAQPKVGEFYDHWDRTTRIPGMLNFGYSSLTDLDSWFAGDREEFVEREAPRALRHFGDLLTLDGWWIEAGRNDAGVHGPCGEPVPCEHAPDDPLCLTDQITYLESLPDDALLVTLKCHV